MIETNRTDDYMDDLTRRKHMGPFLTADIPTILLESGRPSRESALRYLLTGARGAGKTVWCSELARAARERSIVVGGVLSPGVYKDDQRIAIDLADLTTGGVRRLAERQSEESAPRSNSEWAFDQATISWGNEVIQTLGALDLLIIDEVGPLELLHGDGLGEALRLIDHGRYRVAIIVVRPSLLELATERWPDMRLLKLPRA